ncbi:MAG: LysM peptidoglycan-binding domain-containing protein [Acidimicrobiia bacterium]|nr:LysM peptidoglycan-binding domain-containing protein [Actinomycetota bacterium]MBL6925497.1 LysM peptidoglycan-binding domain-containing protein [Acidimicrobiia bacterium]MBL6925690.1 LysM peptidoglycan-binding domain-containing protein [Acidimicrobiia bacterium]
MPAQTLSVSVYRRRRTLAAAVLATVVFLASLAGGELIGRVNGSPGSTPVGAAGEPVVYVVQPGDTLWEIAERINPPGVDLRLTVDRLAVASGGPLILPGQRITLPSGL